VVGGDLARREWSGEACDVGAGGASMWDVAGGAAGDVEMGRSGSGSTSRGEIGEIRSGRSLDYASGEVPMLNLRLMSWSSV
jgi:hypothetical protein